MFLDNPIDYCCSSGGAGTAISSTGMLSGLSVNPRMVPERTGDGIGATGVSTGRETYEMEEEAGMLVVWQETAIRQMQGLHYSSDSDLPELPPEAQLENSIGCSAQAYPGYLRR